MNEKAPDELNQMTNIIDENQNNVMNITFGLSDYGKMNYMMQMADLYREKKKLEIQMRLEPDKAAYCKRFINDVNIQGGKIMAEMQKYVKTNKSVAVVAFAQFQSMSGK